MGCGDAAEAPVSENRLALRVEPEFKELPTWLRSRNLHERRATAVFIGLHPRLEGNGDDEHLSVVSEHAADSASSPSDTALILLMRRALPEASIVCIPVAPDDEAAAMAAIGRALEFKPDAIYVPYGPLINALVDDRSALEAAITECWSAEALVVTVLHDLQTRSTPSGVLPVHVFLDDREGHRDTGGATGSIRVAVGGPESHGEAPPRNTLDAVAVYVMTILLAFPKDGSPRHLEKAARLLVASSTGTLEGKDSAASPRTLDFRTAFEPAEATYLFGEHRYRWGESVADATAERAIFAAKLDRPITPDEHRILVVTRGDTFVRHLAGCGFLTDTLPVLFVPSKLQGTVAFQQWSDGQAWASTYRLFETLQKVENANTSRYIFELVRDDSVTHD